MRAKTGLGSMAAVAAPIAEDRMQPAIGGGALGKIVDQLDMAIALAESLDAERTIKVEHGRMISRQASESVTQYLVPVGIAHDGGNRQLGLASRHRRRQHHGSPLRSRQ